MLDEKTMTDLTDWLLGPPLKIVLILLAAFARLADVDDARRLYEIVFVVVLFSVVVQGSSLALAARHLGVRMRTMS